MKLKNIQRSNLLNFIDYCNKNNISTDGGNCGTFALALAEIYNDSCQIVMCHEVADVDELQYGDVNVYHVVAKIEGKLLDGTGITTADAIYDIAEDQYSDYNADCTEFDFPQEKKIIGNIVNSNTNKTIEVSQYIELYKNLI